MASRRKAQQPGCKSAAATRIGSTVGTGSSAGGATAAAVGSKPSAAVLSVGDLEGRLTEQQQKLAALCSGGQADSTKNQRKRVKKQIAVLKSRIAQAQAPSLAAPANDGTAHASASAEGPASGARGGGTGSGATVTHCPARLRAPDPGTAPVGAPGGFAQTQLAAVDMPLVAAALAEVGPHVHGRRATGKGQNQIEIQNSFGLATAMNTRTNGRRWCMAVEPGCTIEDFPAVAALTRACQRSLGYTGDPCPATLNVIVRRYVQVKSDSISD